MSKDFDALLACVEKPARYTGGEMNADVKPIGQAEISFAFCFPDTYEVAMSHLGMKILYGILNDLPYAVCERVCMPWVDMICALRDSGTSLFSLESHTPLNCFDIIGFTLQYEMSYTNVLEMLDLGGVPVLCSERGERDPIVLAGGPCAFNPEPLHLFIDAFLIGDGEESIVEVTDLLNACKKAGVPRSERLRRLAGLRGVYVPSLYRDQYNQDGTLKSLKPVDPCAPPRVRRSILTDFEHAYVPTHPPVPYIQPVFDRIMLEIMRGCTRGCRFCQAGMLYRPVRERSVDRLVELAKASVQNTGYEEISLSSLSSSDYSCISELARRLTDELKDKRVSLSLPSLRVDKFVQDTLSHTQKVKKSSLTFAPEAGTQRLRDVINKNVTEKDLINTLTNAFSNGWNAVKLYFMMGLPTETEEDLAGIAELAKTAAAAYYSVPRESRVKGFVSHAAPRSLCPNPLRPSSGAVRMTRIPSIASSGWCESSFPGLNPRISTIMIPASARSRPASPSETEGWRPCSIAPGSWAAAWTDGPSSSAMTCGGRRLRTAGWISISMRTAGARWMSSSRGTISTPASTRRF